MATSSHLRLSALLLTVIGLLLLTAPFSLHDWMPPDPMEPHKKATGLLALAMFAGFAVSVGAAVMGFVAVRTRDWMALAMAVPAPAVALALVFHMWSDGM